jgi:hypothetical protein
LATKIDKKNWQQKLKQNLATKSDKKTGNKNLNKCWQQKLKQKFTTKIGKNIDNKNWQQKLTNKNWQQKFSTKFGNNNWLHIVYQNKMSPIISFVFSEQTKESQTQLNSR